MRYKKLTIDKMLRWLPEDGCLIIFNGSNPGWSMQANPKGLQVRTLDRGQKYMKFRDLIITKRK